MKAKLELKDVTLDKVINSDYGCMNCLWSGVECKEHSKFVARVIEAKIPSCEGYTYYD